MIRLDNISKQNGHQLLFIEASMGVQKGEKVGLDAAGARYVTLAQAQSDRAYGDGLSGGSLLDRAAKAKGIDLSDIPAPKSSSKVKQLCT